MKKNLFTRGRTAAICIALSLVLFPVCEITAQAAEVIATVDGTVMTGTTADMLYLATKDGNMIIKIDAGTDVSACRLLLPNQKATVSVSHGSDGYLHAVKITGDAKTPQVTYDASKASVVSGTISDKSTGALLYFNTSAGEMQIKLDYSTDMSGCRVLVADKTYTITCVRGDDAYMHAVIISEGTSGSTAANNNISGAAPAGTVAASTTLVSGTVSDQTKENLLYLATKDGMMQIVIDGNTDSRNGLMLITGKTVSVSVYRGDDAYMHAAVITGKKNPETAASVNSQSGCTVTGTVGSKSTENMLYLNTGGGEMTIKMDALRSLNNCKVLIGGKKISVNCGYGSDAYWHALDISAVQ